MGADTTAMEKNTKEIRLLIQLFDEQCQSDRQTSAQQ